LFHVSDDFSYDFKFAKRDLLNNLILDNQEVIIVKNGFLTDTTYANIALKQGEKWYTPSEPLLEGTKRDFLIENKLIFPKQLHINELHHFSHIKIFNAMMESEAFEIAEIFNY
jgi:4-amino-4-deoxychorismate lyase